MLGIALAGAAPAQGLDPFRLELGFQLDVFSESYGQGDLFFDLEDSPSLDDEVPDVVLESIRSDETLAGGFVDVSWRSATDYERRLDAEYEQDAERSSLTFAGAYRVRPADGWSVGAGSDLRLNHGLTGDDRSRDLVHDVDVWTERALAPRARLRLTARHTFSRVSGDSLYDHDRAGIRARLTAPWGDTTVRAVADVSHRNDYSGYFGDRTRWFGEVGGYTLLATPWRYDATLSVTRYDYQAGVVSPSNTDLDLRSAFTRELSWTWSARVEVDGQLVHYDDPNEAYSSYRLARCRLFGAWSTLSGASAELGIGGEWVRSPDDPTDGDTTTIPDLSGEGDYDESRLIARVGYLGAGDLDLWVDLENAVGYRNYLGSGSTLDFATTDALTLESSDFLFDELTLLFGGAWSVLVVDAFAQYTVEAHDTDADDVSFFLMNVRCGIRFR